MCIWLFLCYSRLRLQKVLSRIICFQYEFILDLNPQSTVHELSITIAQLKLSEDGKILRKNFWVTKLEFFGKSAYQQTWVWPGFKTAVHFIFNCIKWTCILKVLTLSRNNGRIVLIHGAVCMPRFCDTHSPFRGINILIE